jgi:thiol-disulfide isomerase/thioredoxin
MPPLTGAVAWLNSQPLTPESLHGKVVLVDFWTYSCINCLRTVPYVRAWANKYKDHGLVVIGVHTPEGDNHGVDVGASGAGTVDSQRLYQLIRQCRASGSRSRNTTLSRPRIEALAWPVPLSPAPCAMRISGTCLMTGRSPRDCVTA